MILLGASGALIAVPAHKPRERTTTAAGTLTARFDSRPSPPEKIRGRLTVELCAEERAQHAAAVRFADSVGADDTEVLAHSLAAGRYRIAELAAAIHRLDAGSYGICERCSRPIAPERLEFLPHVRYCVACQSESDTNLIH